MASDGKTEAKFQSKRIYVAGKWAERERIHKIIELLEKSGHTITHDWTQLETGTRTLEFNQRCASFDLGGVNDADLVIADMTDPLYRYQGTCTEIGAALITDTPVWYIGDLRHGVFFTLCEHFADWKQVFRILNPPSQLQRMLADYDKMIEEIRAKYDTTLT